MGYSGRVCTRDGCADFDACHQAVNDWQGELAFCEQEDMPRTAPPKEHIDWAKYEHLFGKISDYKLAATLGCGAGTVGYQRHKRGVPIFKETLDWPDQECECGCGHATRRATKTSTEKNWIKGKPIRFIAGHQRRKRRND